MNYNQFKRDMKDNRYVRLLLYPWGIRKFRNEYRRYQESEWPGVVKTFKKKHEGERCFIIGNGPSLTAEDLDLIKDEISFAANKIYKIYERTSWRPTYYICMDYMSLAEGIAADLYQIEADTLFINWQQRELVGKKGNVVYINANPRYVVNIWNDREVVFSENCDQFIDNARTVTYTAIQLAAYMGFKEIYLLGVDATYPFYKDGKGRKHSTTTAEAHFKDGGYNRIDYLVKETNEYGFSKAKDHCRINNIKIENVTRGGRLDAFDRKELEDVLTGK